MNIKPQYFALIALLFIGGVLGILFFGTGNMGDLFSRSVNPVPEEKSVDGAEPRPVAESLDNISTADVSRDDIDKLIGELQQELLMAENDPDKAMELRRRIQILKAQKQALSSSLDSQDV